MDTDTSQLPLDLLEPAAARWATTARRGSRRGPPRVRSTLGPQSDVVDTGVFVCPNTVVAALYAPPSASPSTSAAAAAAATVVVTAESGGWLRVREQRTGAIRHQQQLRDGGEASCLAWASAASTVPVVVVGQLSGLLCFYALVGESLVELPAATCVFHEAPLLTCAALPPQPTSSSPAVVHGPDSALLSLDADGVLALWSLQTAPVAGHTAAVVPVLAVRLVDCSYACPAAASSSTSDELGNSVASAVVVAAPAAAVDDASRRWCVFTSHRFAPDPTTESETAAGRDAPGERESDVAAVYLSEFALDAARPHAGAAADGLEATSLEVGDESGSAASGPSPSPPPPQSAQCPGWVVRRSYGVPSALRQRRSVATARGGAECAASPPTITALCVTSHGSAAEADVQLWAGTADGRLLVWEALTGRFVRALVCESAAPVHHLATVAAPPNSTATGPALVWASQADGCVVAWSAATYAVTEVLPVSYPPTFARGPGGAVVGAGGSAPVVAVRDAVDLLRATRHAQDGVAGLAPRSGFTLFVEPMEVVCMQRAWSVATDGTVRTWLLPAGEVRLQGGTGTSGTAGAAAAATGASAACGSAAVLDAHTVHCFLEDQADVFVRTTQAHEVAQAALLEQVRALQERNGVLAAALQQAVTRLERVGGDGLVRSASRSAESADGGSAASQESSVADPRSPTPLATLSPTSSADGRRVAEAAAADRSTPSTPSTPIAALSPPSRTPPLAIESATSAPAAQAAHVRTLQSLLEELHARLEESWSRNDALREELLVYQLRTLEREDDTARRVRATATATAAVNSTTDGATVAAAPTDDGAYAAGGARPITAGQGVAPAPASTSDGAAVLLLPPPPPAQPATAQEGPSAAPPAPPAAALEPPPRSTTAPPQQQEHHEDEGETERPPVTPPRASTRGHTPSRTLRSPSVAELVQRQRPIAPPPLTPPPPLDTLMAAAQEGEMEEVLRLQDMPPSVDPHAPSAAARAAAAPTRQLNGSPALTTTTTAAAQRFLAAAAAAVAAPVQGGAGAPSRRRVPSPPLLSVAVDEDAYTEEEAVMVSAGDGDGDDSEPALIDAWCASESEDDLSPIPGPSPRGLLGQSGVASADASSFAAGVPHHPTSSSLLSSYPYLSTSFAARPTARELRPHRAPPGSTAAQVVTATWASPAREESRHRSAGVHGSGASAAAAAYRSPAATAAHFSRDLAAAGGSAAARGTPLRQPSAPSAVASASTPHSFHSPIIYRFA